MDAKTALMTGVAIETAIAMRIANTKTAVAAAEQMMHPGTSVAGEGLTMGRAIFAGAAGPTMAPITSAAGVDATMRRAMIAEDAAGNVMTAAMMIGAAMTGRIAVAGEEAIQTIRQIASMTAIQLPTPLARVADVGAVKVAVAEETIVPQAIEPAGSRVAPAWHNRVGAALPRMRKHADIQIKM